MGNLIVKTLLFFGDVRKENGQNPEKVFTVCSDTVSQSIERGRITREEPSMFAKVENGVTKSC